MGAAASGVPTTPPEAWMQTQAADVLVAVTAELPPATNAVMVRTPAGELLVIRDAS